MSLPGGGGGAAELAAALGCSEEWAVEECLEPGVPGVPAAACTPAAKRAAAPRTARSGRHRFMVSCPGIHVRNLVNRFEELE